MSTIFLDRDGVINENRADYVKSWDEFRFLAGSVEAIAHLTQAGHRLFVCTNQACIAQGNVSREIVEDIHSRMAHVIAEAGGLIEKIYFCPHAKDANCSCRKPRPGMLQQARDEWGLDLSDSYFIGDSMTDIRAGLAAGVHPILVLTGLGGTQFRTLHQEAHGPFRIALNLPDAANLILQGKAACTDEQTELERTCYSLLTAAPSELDHLVEQKGSFISEQRAQSPTVVNQSLKIW